MIFSQRARGIIQAIAVALSLALPLVLAVSSADARIGGGISSGSRGTRTFSAPPSTSTAPSTAQPFNRTITQPSSPGLGAPPPAAAFSTGRALACSAGSPRASLGAGLLGMLFGGGMFGGLGGLSSLFGLILQIGLIIIVVRLAMSWWQRRHATASAYAGSSMGGLGAPSSFRSGTGFGWGPAARRSRSCRAITKPSNDCSVTFRRRGRAKISPGCTRWPRRRWSRTSPRTWRRTRPATTSTRSPT